MGRWSRITEPVGAGPGLLPRASSPASEHLGSKPSSPGRLAGLGLPLVVQGSPHPSQLPARTYSGRSRQRELEGWTSAALAGSEPGLPELGKAGLSRTRQALGEGAQRDQTQLGGRRRGTVTKESSGTVEPRSSGQQGHLGPLRRRLLPQEANVPDGLILQLGPEQGIQLSQDGNEPEEVTADSSGHQHSDDHSAIGSFGYEPGPSDADEAPERGEDDDREGEGVRRHGQVRDAGQSCGCSAGYLSRPGRGLRACAAGPCRRERARSAAPLAHARQLDTRDGREL